MTAIKWIKRLVILPGLVAALGSVFVANPADARVSIGIGGISVGSHRESSVSIWFGSGYPYYGRGSYYHYGYRPYYRYYSPYYGYRSPYYYGHGYQPYPRYYDPHRRYDYDRRGHGRARDWDRRR